MGKLKIYEQLQNMAPDIWYLQSIVNHGHQTCLTSAGHYEFVKYLCTGPLPLEQVLDFLLVSFSFAWKIDMRLEFSFYPEFLPH